MRERQEAGRQKQGCGTDREEEIWGCGAGRKKGQRRRCGMRGREEEGAEAEMRGRAGGSDEDAGQEGETRMRGRVGEAERRRKKQREGGRSRGKIEEEATRAKIVEAKWHWQWRIDKEAIAEVRKRDTTINHNDEAIEHLHMKGVTGKSLRERNIVQERMRRIIIVHIKQNTFHDAFEPLTMWQPTKMCCKEIKHEVSVMTEARMND
jgi:hypothetical protein